MQETPDTAKHCRDCGGELVGPPYRYGDLCRLCAEDRYGDADECAVCPADADVLDDGMVPLLDASAGATSTVWPEPTLPVM